MQPQIITRSTSVTKDTLLSTSSCNDYVSIAITHFNEGVLKDTGAWVEETVFTLPSVFDNKNTGGTAFYVNTWRQGTLSMFYKDKEDKVYLLASSVAKEIYENTNYFSDVLNAFKLGEQLNG